MNKKTQLEATQEGIKLANELVKEILDKNVDKDLVIITISSVLHCLSLKIADAHSTEFVAKLVAHALEQSENGKNKSEYLN